MIHVVTNRRLKMTEKQKSEVTTLRKLGLGYKAIAKRMSVSVDAVKYYCRTHNLQAKDIPDNVCPICGAPISQTPHKRKKVFCSGKCRIAHWRLMQTRRICECCKESFIPAHPTSKYCSFDCYIKARFYGGLDAV